MRLGWLSEKSSSQTIRICTALVIAQGVLLSIVYLGGLDVGSSESGGLVERMISAATNLSPCIPVLLFPYVAWVSRTFAFPHRDDAHILVLSAVFALLCVTGYALERAETVGVLFDSVFWPLSLVSILFIGAFFYSLIKPFYEAILSHNCFLRPESSSEGLDLFASVPDYGHPMLFRLLPLLFLLAWLPYIIACLPASVNDDTSYMLAQFEGFTRPNTHHPLFASGVYGVIFTLGKCVAGNGGGWVALVTAQTMCFIAASVFEIRVIRHFNVRFRVVVACVAFFMICPIFGGYCARVVKDSMFCSAFIVFACLVALYCKSPEEFSRSPIWMGALVLFSVLVGLLRNNGFYVILFALPFLLCQFQRLSLKGMLLKALPLVLAIVLVPASNLALMAITHAYTGASVKEAFSLPFQQTARCLTKHADDVEEWEHDAINAVLDFDALPELYNPQTSDPVKKTFKKDGSLFEYFQAYMSMGLRHPITYFDATAINTYGYWLPPSTSIANGQGVGIQQTTSKNEQYGYDWSPWLPTDMRNIIEEYVDAFVAIPYASFLMRPGTYTWLLLMGVALLLKNRRGRACCVLLPSLLLLLSCIASPVNGSIRYALGMIAAMPVCLVAVLWFSRMDQRGVQSS